MLVNCLAAIVRQKSFCFVSALRAAFSRVMMRSQRGRSLSLVARLTSLASLSWLLRGRPRTLLLSPESSEDRINRQDERASFSQNQTAVDGERQF